MVYLLGFTNVIEMCCLDIMNLNVCLKRQPGAVLLPYFYYSKEIKGPDINQITTLGPIMTSSETWDEGLGMNAGG